MPTKYTRRGLQPPFIRVGMAEEGSVQCWRVLEVVYRGHGLQV